MSLPKGAWTTITDFLVERFPAINRVTWLERMAHGLVVDELGVAVTPGRAYQGQLRVYYYRALGREARIPFDETVIFQDEHLVVADKPHFLPVTPSGHYLQETLLVRLKNRLQISTLVPLHRIDRETAGLVLFSVRPEDRNAYQTLFRTRTIHKFYEAIAPRCSHLHFPLTRATRIAQGDVFFRQQEVAGQPNSQTHIDVLDVQGSLARYALNPVTGQKHQLRVHMNALGLPIVNDRLYPTAASPLSDDFEAPLQLLARSISFTDPVTGHAREFHTAHTLQWKTLGTAEAALTTVPEPDGTAPIDAA